MLSSICGVIPMQGKFEAAIEDYTTAIQLNPTHCRAYYNRAFSHDRLHQHVEAVADYSRALDIEPGNATALHNRGSLYERLGRWVVLMRSWWAAACMQGEHVCCQAPICGPSSPQRIHILCSGGQVAGCTA